MKTYRKTWQPSDLALIMGIAVLSDIMASLPFSLGIVSAMIAIPAMLFAPGYAMTRLIVSSDRFGALERVVLSLGLSIAVTILGGILLNFSPFGLNVVAFTWLVSLVTITCAVLAWRKGDQKLTLPRLALRPAHWLWFGLAAILVVSAFALSVYGAQTYQNTAFTQAWLLPADSAHVTLGLHNDEGHTETYQVTLVVNGKLAHQWKNITLTTQQGWQQSYAVSGPPGAHVLVKIYRMENPTTVYRTVTYTIPVIATPTRAAGA
jgi:uncharacterized membrane protein